MTQYPDEEHIEQLRTTDTALGDALYLDYGASPPLLHSSLAAFQDVARRTLLSNPHSRSPASEATTLAIDRVRARLLRDLLGLHDPRHAAEWDVCFTSGATAACRLIAQHFDWQQSRRSTGPNRESEPASSYAYLASAAHTSLVGIRAAALQAGATVHPLSPAQLVHHAQTTSSPEQEEEEGSHILGHNHLFAYPSQCNATGRCFSLDLCKHIKQASAQNYVVLDAAASLATTSLDLSAHYDKPDVLPDFITWSAYKTYGWPTGLGCLFVKKSAAARALKKQGYFGGGTLDAMAVREPFTTRPAAPPADGPLHRAFEDGTVPFLDIVALDAVMDNFERRFGGPLSSGLVARHARSLTVWTAHHMRQLRHANGQPVCRLHYDNLQDEDDDEGTASPYIAPHGTAIAFTILDRQGGPVGHVEVDKLAAVNDVHIRTGGLCNIGALAHAMHLTDADLLQGARVCWDEQEFVHGKPTGLARVSFGALSTRQDAQRWIAFLSNFFVSGKLDQKDERQQLEAERQRPPLPYELRELCLYPIKSCAAMRVETGVRWPLGPRGLAYDREWMVVSQATGAALSQKRYTNMACITPTIDPSRRLLRIVLPPPQAQTFELSLELTETEAHQLLSQARVCSEQVQTVRHSTQALDLALSQWIGVPCTLHRSLDSCASRHSHLKQGSSEAGAATTTTDRIPIALSNESPFLVVHQASVDQLSRLCGQTISAAAFRSNFVVAGSSHSDAQTTPFAEDAWTSLKIGQQIFQVLSYCRRCQMINVDQKTGHKLKEPYNILSRTRRNDKGHLCFGLHLYHRRDLSQEPFEVFAGALIEPTRCV